jgi:hypothetical protein
MVLVNASAAQGDRSAYKKDITMNNLPSNYQNSNIFFNETISVNQ